MPVRNAFACAVLLLLLGGCGDSSDPGQSTPAGLWSLSFEGPLHNVAGNPIGSCHTDFVIKIVEVSSDPLDQFEARVPVTAKPICNDEPALDFPEILMVIRQDGDQITFLVNGQDVLVTATLSFGSMVGSVPDRSFEYLARASGPAGSPGPPIPTRPPPTSGYHGAGPISWWTTASWSAVPSGQATATSFRTWTSSGAPPTLRWPRWSRAERTSSPSRLRECLA
jgi:hypothetical protein